MQKDNKGSELTLEYELLTLRAIGDMLEETVSYENLDADDFKKFLVRELKMKRRDADTVWNGFKIHYYSHLNPYLKFKYRNPEYFDLIQKNKKQIKDIVKESKDSLRKDSKHIRLEDLADFFSDISTAVNDGMRVNGIKAEKRTEIIKKLGLIMQKLIDTKVRGG